MCVCRSFWGLDNHESDFLLVYRAQGILPKFQSPYKWRQSDLKPITDWFCSSLYDLGPGSSSGAGSWLAPVNREKETRFSSSVSKVRPSCLHANSMTALGALDSSRWKGSHSWLEFLGCYTKSLLPFSRQFIGLCSLTLPPFPKQSKQNPSSATQQHLPKVLAAYLT